MLPQPSEVANAHAAMCVRAYRALHTLCIYATVIVCCVKRATRLVRDQSQSGS